MRRTFNGSPCNGSDSPATGAIGCGRRSPVSSPQWLLGLAPPRFKTGPTKDNLVPVIPEMILAKLAVMFEANPRRKEVRLIASVPRKPSGKLLKGDPRIS